MWLLPTAVSNERRRLKHAVAQLPNRADGGRPEQTVQLMRSGNRIKFRLRSRGVTLVIATNRVVRLVTRSTLTASQWTTRQLVLTTSWCAPENLCLYCIHLQTIWPHPLRDTSDVLCGAVSKITYNTRFAEPIELHIIQVGMQATQPYNVDEVIRVSSRTRKYQRNSSMTIHIYIWFILTISAYYSLINLDTK
jgi:hypothetical protein